MGTVEELFQKFLAAVCSDTEKVSQYNRAIAALAAFARVEGVGYRLTTNHKNHYISRWRVSRAALDRVEHTLRQAWRVRTKAVAPYSGLKVGAAVLSSSGEVVHGVNIESSSYGLTLCAERAALAAACVAFQKPIALVSIAADTPRPLSPCGACRQWLVELAPDAMVVVVCSRHRRWYLAGELLPDPFGPGMLPTHKV